MVQSVVSTTLSQRAAMVAEPAMSVRRKRMPLPAGAGFKVREIFWPECSATPMQLAGRARVRCTELFPMAKSTRLLALMRVYFLPSANVGLVDVLQHYYGEPFMSVSSQPPQTRTKFIRHVGSLYHAS